MALACLAAEAEHAVDKLDRRGFALIDGSAALTAEALATFDALSARSDESAPIAPDHPLVAALLALPAVDDLVTQAVGPDARPLRALALDQSGPGGGFLPWQQLSGGLPAEVLAKMLVLRWHLDLIGPADGGLRVLPGSHAKGRLTPEQIAELVTGTPAVELAVSAGTVLALRPLLVHGARRRATRGHRRILQVELAAGDLPTSLDWTWA